MKCTIAFRLHHTSLSFPIGTKITLHTSQVHPTVLDAIDRLFPEEVVLDWLRELGKANGSEFGPDGLGSVFAPEELSELGIPIRLVPGTAERLYAKLCALQRAVRSAARDGHRLTNMDLLSAAEAPVAAYYRHAREVVGGAGGNEGRALDPQAVYEFVYSSNAPPFEGRSRSRAGSYRLCA